MRNNKILLNPLQVTPALSFIALVLVLISLLGQLVVYLTGHDHVYGLIELVNVDSEQNIPTSFSVFLLMSSAVLLIVIAVLEKKHDRSDAVYWALLGLVFFFLAVDEGAAIHDMLNDPLRDVLGGDNLGMFYFPWVLPAAVGVLALLLFFAKFMRRLPAATRSGFLLAGAVYVSGSVGLEVVGAYYFEIYGKYYLSYILIATLEETFEMAGIILFIHTLLTHIADKYGSVLIRFTGPDGTD